MKKTGLGRGLDALIDTSHVDTNGGSSISEIALDSIVANPDQPRRTFDEEALQELADSIREHGVISPITLRDNGDGTYMLIAGERRFRASKIAGLDRIPAYIRTAKDEQVMEWALIENIQRVDLNPVEIARSYQQLIDKHGYTHEDLSKIVSKSRSAITNSLRLLKLPEQVLLWIEEGKLNSGAARALCSDKIGDPESLAERIIEEGLNVRQIEAIIRGDDDRDEEQGDGPAKKPETPAKPKPELSADMKQFETRLETFFGTKVQLNPSASDSGKGTIVINYYSMDDLTRIQEIMENR